MNKFNAFQAAKIEQTNDVMGGNLPGMLLKGLHATAEYIVKLSGIAPIFEPIDAAIIHPLLWNPLSIIFNYPVADHPPGVTPANTVLRKYGLPTTYSYVPTNFKQQTTTKRRQ